MLQQAIAAYHRFTNRAGRPGSSRPSVSLEVMALEERATPSATPIVPLAAPPTVLVGSLAIPIPGQSIVIDLAAVGESPVSQSADDAVDLRGHQQQSAAPPAPRASAEQLAAIQAELEEFLAGQQAA